MLTREMLNTLMEEEVPVTLHLEGSTDTVVGIISEFLDDWRDSPYTEHDDVPHHLYLIDGNERHIVSWRNISAISYAVPNDKSVSSDASD